MKQWNLVLVLCMLVSGVAVATPAVVINPAGSCGVLDGNGGFTSTTDTQVVATYSKNGNTMLKCKAKGLANDTGRAAHFDYASTSTLCVIGGPVPSVTSDWKETVSADGNATLICRSE